jgi:lipopolysaccharide transport system permease protein
MLKHHERKLDNKDRKIMEIIKEIKFSKTIIFRLSFNKLKLSYVQTVLGPFYHYFLPFFQTLIFNFLLTDIANIEVSAGGQYPNFLFYFTGFVMWNYFASSTTQMSTVYLEHNKIIENIYVSRLTFFFIPLINNFIPLIMGLINIFIMVIYFEINNGLISKIFYLLPIILLTIILSTSLGLIVAGLSIKYRDIIKSIGVLLQFFLMFSGVLYSQGQIPDNFHLIAYLNPFFLITETSRWIWLSNPFLINTDQIFSQLFITLIFFVLSIIIFKKTEKNIADYL